MQKITLALAALLLCFNYSLAQTSNNLIANNSGTSITNIEKEITIPSNIVFTKVVDNLPEEAIIYCIEFAKRKGYVTDIYARGKSFFPKVNKVFAKYNVPTEVNVLLAIESYFKKDLVSTAGAVGYWQFMDATAVEYGLSIDSAKDERKDFAKSTKAAAKYLKTHYAVLKDWNLTVASYNCGLGNVKKAMAKSGISNPSFFDIKKFLPKETQNYVMKYIALNVLYKNYALYTSGKLQWHSSTQKVKVEPNETVTETMVTSLNK